MTAEVVQEILHLPPNSTDKELSSNDILNSINYNEDTSNLRKIYKSARGRNEISSVTPLSKHSLARYLILMSLLRLWEISPICY